MRNLFIHIFFGSIGLMGFFIPFYDLLFKNGKGFILPSAHLFLIKYSFFFTFVYISIVIFFIPLFLKKEYICADYVNSDKFARAKSDFFLGTILVPAWIFGCIAYWALSFDKILLIGFMLLSIIWYLKSIFTIVNN